MSEPRTFEEWCEHRYLLDGKTTFERDRAVWNDSRAALLADRPDVARLIESLNSEIPDYEHPDAPKGTVEVLRDCRRALQSLAAQLAEKEQESEDDDKLRSKMDDILTRTANALKGDPAPNRLHDWSDLPFLAELSVELAKQAAEKLAAERDKLKEDAERRAGRKLWLWRNHVDGRPEYWAFDNPFPIYLDSWDPQTLGEPCGYAIFKPSRSGKPNADEAEVLRSIARANALDAARKK